MSVFDDIKSLRSHYKNRLNWYLSVIDAIEDEIQDLWRDYLSIKKPPIAKSIKLLELNNSFVILKSSIEYFRQCVLIVEKRLDDLEKQEYALLNKGDDPVN
jgi:hypothetical protein